MENKKQLIIIPPMSAPLQKLSEVLHGVAAEENVEISIIDDPKELMQFMGSAGQSLLAFSNAKHCAIFLQENRFILAKNHSKVILLTPKEIPAKTLTKFQKLGLTEAILDTSPPKTLLYKVKFLLRSIRSASLQQEDKDQVVKNLIDITSGAAKSEIDIAKPRSENVMVQDLPKFKTDSDQNNSEDDGPLKSKALTLEDSIETHWKSNRKNTEGLLKDGPEALQIKEQATSEIDMYYRGKKDKKNNELLIEEAKDHNRKNIFQEDEQEKDELSKKNQGSEIFLDIGAPESSAAKEYLKDESDLIQTPDKESLTLEASDEQLRPEEIITEEEKAEKRKKEFEELDFLFAEAKKRQTAELTEDLGGYLKGKIRSDVEIFEEEEQQEDKEKKEYDNSELHETKKSFDLDLASGTENEKNRSKAEEEDVEKNSSKAYLKITPQNIVGENGSTDKINTLMMSDLGEDKSKKIRTLDIFNLDLKKENKKIDEYEQEDFKKRKNNLNLNDIIEQDNTLETRNEDLEDESENESEKSKSISLSLESAEVGTTKNESVREALEEDEGHGRNFAPLQLDGREQKHEKTENEEIDPTMNYRKLKHTDLNLDQTNKKANTSGKVDKIETHYRSGEGDKVEYSWDNLNNKKMDVNFQTEKSRRQDDETEMRQSGKDKGEVTIDYRKLKEEFEQISRNRQSFSEDNNLAKNTHSLLDSEDDNTSKVIEIDANGFDFGINIVNLIYQKDSKVLDFYKTTAEELITKYKGYPVFYTFKSSDNKHNETFDSFMHFSTSIVSNELKEWWLTIKSQEENLAFYFQKTITTWLCREIKDKSGIEGKFWEDIELPSWADNELSSKKVELIFPYYDGLDRMGVAVVFFPNGLNPKIEKGLTVTLEMMRTILLDGTQKKSIAVEHAQEDTQTKDGVPPENKVLNMFKGFFSRNKAG